MSHIAMVSIGAHGHVNPSLPVIAELVRRGHRVSYAIPESFASTVASSGATALVYKSLLPDEAQGQQWPSELVPALTLFLDEAVHMLPQLRSAFAADQPDLVLYDIAGYPARVLAHQWGVPLVQFSPTLVAWEGYEEEMAQAYPPFMRTRRGNAIWPGSPNGSLRRGYRCQRTSSPDGRHAAWC